MGFANHENDSLLTRLRLFRFWAEKEFEVVIDGERRKIRCRAGSNESKQAAEELCRQKAERVQLIVDKKVKRQNSYEKPTREHIIEEIDSENIITRNYYGALILNTSSVNIFDIDTYQKTFWERLTFKKIDNKQGIIGLLRRLHAEQIIPGTTWRIYETCKGIRVMVLGRFIEPGSEQFKNFCEKSNADGLYSWLCIQQRCYRARLTPKPYRMHIECIKYRCPVPEGQEQAYKNWEHEYANAARGFAVCRYVETLGGGVVDSRIIDLHDRYCLNDQAEKLA